MNYLVQGTMTEGELPRCAVSKEEAEKILANAMAAFRKVMTGKAVPVSMNTDADMGSQWMTKSPEAR